VIRFDAVAFDYGPHRPVFHDCSFHLQPGRRLALTGPNGSGKTTLLHLIVGLLAPRAGRIEAFGQVRRQPADFHEVRRRAGLLFQDADDQLFCPTVAEDVAFGPLNLGKPRHEVQRLVSQTLEQLGLCGYEDRVTHRLSGGEKRLVALATVLAMQPDVLLLDEPTGGLDEAAAECITQLLLDLPQAMLIVSHDRQFLRNVAQGALLVRNRRLEQVAEV